MKAIELALSPSESNLLGSARRGAKKSTAHTSFSRLWVPLFGVFLGNL
jgi:hypothetical protein